MSQILVFGASTTYGHYDEDGGWVQRLRKEIDRKMIAHNFEPYHVVYNLGIDGDQSEGVLNRLENETEVRVWDDEVIILICIGINDSMVFHETNRPVTSPADYQKNLEAIVRKAQKFSQKIILVGLFPVDEKRVDPIPWLEGHSYKNEYIKMYEEIMESVAHLNHTHFIPLFDRLSNEAKKLLSDGVHPNSKGHEAIFEVVKEYLISSKILKL